MLLLQLWYVHWSGGGSKVLAETLSPVLGIR